MKHCRYLFSAAAATLPMALLFLPEEKAAVVPGNYPEQLALIFICGYITQVYALPGAKTRESPDPAFNYFRMNAHAEKDHREWASRMPSLEFLEKPVSVLNLLLILENYFIAGTSQYEPTTDR